MKRINKMKRNGDSFLKDLFRLKSSGKFKALIEMFRDGVSIDLLKSLNDTSRELERMGKKMHGPSFKRSRYKLSDFFTDA